MGSPRRPRPARGAFGNTGLGLQGIAKGFVAGMGRFFESPGPVLVIGVVVPAAAAAKDLGPICRVSRGGDLQSHVVGHAPDMAEGTVPSLEAA